MLCQHPLHSCQSTAQCFFKGPCVCVSHCSIDPIPVLASHDGTHTHAHSLKVFACVHEEADLHSPH